jgi:hypothetical protein
VAPLDPEQVALLRGVVRERRSALAVVEVQLVLAMRHLQVVVLPNQVSVPASTPYLAVLLAAERALTASA